MLISLLLKLKVDINHIIYLKENVHSPAEIENESWWWFRFNILAKFPLLLQVWVCRSRSRYSARRGWHNWGKKPGHASSICSQPIRGQYPGHVTTLDQSEASRLLNMRPALVCPGIIVKLQPLLQLKSQWSRDENYWLLKLYLSQTKTVQKLKIIPGWPKSDPMIH